MVEFYLTGDGDGDGDGVLALSDWQELRPVIEALPGNCVSGWICTWTRGPSMVRPGPDSIALGWGRSGILRRWGPSWARSWRSAGRSGWLPGP